MSAHVPVLDFRRVETDHAAFVQDLGNAYREFGFCCFVNHGIPDDVVARAYEDSKAFFALPEEVKRRYISHQLPGVRGFTPNKVETAKDATIADLKEFWHIGREVEGPNPYPNILLPNLWPDEVPGFHVHGLLLYRTMEKVGRRLLAAMLENIGEKPDLLEPHLDYGNSILRILHYPPVQTEDLPAVRASAHEDISLITILVGATDAGLELKTKTGEWLPIEAPPGSIIVNVGDMFQRLTNHVYPSTTHRVVNPEGAAATRARYSMPFFMDPNPDYLIQTLDSCISSERPNRYPAPILANDYLMERLHEIKMTPRS